MKARPQSLVDCRKLKGLSQAEVARQAQTTPSYLCKLESGDMPGSVQVLQRLAGVLGVSIETITDNDGTYRPSRQKKEVAA